MVLFRKPKTCPVQGRRYSIETQEGNGLHDFTVRVNKKVMEFSQRSSELTFTVPEDAFGVMIIKVQDEDRDLDMIVLEVEEPVKTPEV